MPKNKSKLNNSKSYRTFLTLHDVGDKLEIYAKSDPRFATRSEACRHLLEQGFKADKKARAKAMGTVSV